MLRTSQIKYKITVWSIIPFPGTGSREKENENTFTVAWQTERKGEPVSRSSVWLGRDWYVEYFSALKRDKAETYYNDRP